ncbi:AAA family ATPase [Costertonia aggregata]|uniref:AAA family ATPase n=1 Tax=Costertonia aggregata TaxID=343403 RepID=A0A7H9AMP8_9FLAO|nr:AAA family ATPase [Costertonia aggregata]QLG44697.1 AAA family ATPase [Costertonia aggregata]
MKILIFGASGSGTTTIGKEFAKRTGYAHLDADDYYWKKTDPPFRVKIPLAERNTKLKADFNNNKNVVLSGSMVSWGKEWETSFDLVVFIELDSEERIQRLRQRERERYGSRLLSDEQIKRNSEDFLNWAKQYENPDFEGRSLKVHNNWIGLLNCRVMRIDGCLELNEKLEKILSNLNAI